MDLAIEANRNSALFNTMQQVLDVYNPLLHKARPTVVNQTKHRIRTNPTRWGNTFDKWNGQRTVRFDLPRIGSLMDFTLKCAFQIPGVEPTEQNRIDFGDRGIAKQTLTTGSLNNTDTANNTARGRLDRVYADKLLGFNMIRRYTVSSKSRQIFSASGEYLLVRFSQMDSDMKETVMKSITPVNLYSASADDAFYAPGISYMMTIPLFMFFNEHITNALDVNFSEEVHIDIELRSPSELFYYGQLGDLKFITDKTQIPGTITGANQTYPYAGLASEYVTWDQATSGSVDDPFVDGRELVGYTNLINFALRHIQGIGPPYGNFGHQYGLNEADSGPTFAYPNVDNNGESVVIQFEANADYILQDTDAYRALRAQMFPEGTGLTTIVYDTAQETFTDLFNSITPSQNLLSARSGGSFVDPSQSPSGITTGDSTRYVDLSLKVNNLVFATHFMVRKTSDMGADGNTIAGWDTPVYGKSISAANKKLGAHRIYTRLLPVHYFQILAAGRVIYESDGDSHLNLTQSGLYNGTGKDFGTPSTSNIALSHSGRAARTVGGTPFNVYSINFGLQSSRLENTGALSYQNLNNPTLRIYFKPDDWSEHINLKSADGVSEAELAASLGVRVDVIHEFFNVVTINSGNGEITSGLNQ